MTVDDLQPVIGAPVADDDAPFADGYTAYRTDWRDTDAAIDLEQLLGDESAIDLEADPSEASATPSPTTAPPHTPKVASRRSSTRPQ